MTIIESHRDEIERLCRQFGVARLAVFGSVTGSRFDVSTSDIDLLVAFAPTTRTTRSIGTSA